MKPNKRTTAKHVVKPMLASEVAKGEATVCEYKYDDITIDFSKGKVICNNCHLELE